jgi:putative nucleotidyltransferase with HDIG domain
MPLTQKDIHRRLIKRLFLGWIFLSIALGIVVFFVEMEKIDDFVVNLALEESSFFTRDGRSYRSIDEQNRENLLTLSRHQIRERHFVIVEFYDRNKKQIVEVFNAESEAVEKVINKHKHDLIMTDTVQYKKFYIDGHIYLQVIVPLKSDSREVGGYFEGIYRADSKTMDNIREGVVWSLGLITIIVFATTVLLYPIIIALNKDLMTLSIDLSRANIGMLKSLGGAISKRDSDTHTHNYRVTLYAISLAEEVGLNKEDIRALIKGAFLHDIGKIAISDNILLKQGRLTTEEFGIMKTHVRHGVDIITKYNWLRDAMDVVSYHHEKYDGSGYIAGLKGDAIPVNARIFAIADYFDALTSKRPYKDAYSFEEAMQIIEDNRSKHFDPAMLDVFGRIALSLYADIGRTADAALEKTLDSIIDRYFYNA